MKILFPRNIGQKYYGLHYKFILNLLEFMHLDIELYELAHRTAGGYIIRINDKRILIDFGDFLKLAEGAELFDACFKYHYTQEICGPFKRVHPIGPVSFHDWDEYYTLAEQIVYSCKTERVLNNQRPRKGSKIRRLRVRAMLNDKYGSLVDFKQTNRPDFWQKINDCLVSVCVPGQRKDILDRGQFQYMAFGACTISPWLNIMLPYMKELEPGRHYIQCADDYSDLIEKIEWCKRHRPMCREIGQNAKKLFIETCTPRAIWHWMGMVLKLDFSKINKFETIPKFKLEKGGLSLQEIRAIRATLKEKLRRGKKKDIEEKEIES